jgi:hypothetical protein
MADMVDMEDTAEAMVDMVSSPQFNIVSFS